MTDEEIKDVCKEKIWYRFLSTEEKQIILFVHDNKSVVVKTVKNEDLDKNLEACREILYGALKEMFHNSING
jgi:hypothetical protein